MQWVCFCEAWPRACRQHGCAPHCPTPCSPLPQWLLTLSTSAQTTVVGPAFFPIVQSTLPLRFLPSWARFQFCMPVSLVYFLAEIQNCQDNCSLGYPSCIHITCFQVSRQRWECTEDKSHSCSLRRLEPAGRAFQYSFFYVSLLIFSLN